MDFTEKLLYHIWDAQHIVKKPQTVSGKQLMVMYHGQWNNDFGPDFRNGIINIDGEVYRGNIEIHTKTYDWVAHKHTEDANFNDTILHVVYEHNGQYPYTISEDGSKIEILELKEYLDQDLAKLIKKFGQASGYYPELCLFFSGMNNDTLGLLLTSLGLSRMEKKVKRYGAELFFSDFNQLIYQGIMEAAGYSKNSYNMLQIAMIYPYVDLLRWKNEGLTGEELAAIFIYGSGLDSNIPKTVAQETQTIWKDAFIRQQYTAKKREFKWNLFRVRPINHPVIRIIQMTSFIYYSLDSDLLQMFSEMFSHSNAVTIAKTISKDLVTLFNREEIPSRNFIGTDRIDLMIINILLPILILYADKVNNQTIKQNIQKIYRDYKGLTTNHIEHFMKQKFLSKSQQKLIAGKAIYQQAILKLYYDYCRYHNCALCQTHKKDLILNM